MTKGNILFADALPEAIRLLSASGLDMEKTVIVRDIYGRINIAFDGPRNEAVGNLEKMVEALGAYHVPGSRIFCREDLLEPEQLFDDRAIVRYQHPDMEPQRGAVRLLDRQVVGRDWLIPGKPGKIPRLVFYGIKGGVGRSTAISFLAARLANTGRGKKILCVDLDLESPGISSMLMPMDNRNDYGLVDWFVEDAVGQGDKILPAMISDSPLGNNTIGAIKVAAVSGRKSGKEVFVPKLARAYAEINHQGTVERFGERAQRLIESLEKEVRPDIVLIDSRAGLHDLAAISIVTLSTFSYLFAVGSAQNWENYRSLFSHWQTVPQVARSIRERLAMVQALFPEWDQEKRNRAFIEASHDLFSNTLYESMEPEEEMDKDLFNFNLNDTDAPHYPVKILWNSRFQEVNPAQIEKDIIPQSLVDTTFGDFFNRVENDLERVNNG